MTHPFTPPEREEDPRDDDQREEDRCIDIARLSASVLKPGEDGYDYVNKESQFDPHPWVIRAIRTALEAGRSEGRAALEAEHQMLANAIEEKFDAREHHLVSSAFAVIIEAALTGKQALYERNDGKLQCTFNTVLGRTIHDRYKVSYNLKDESDLTVILEKK